MSLLDNEGMPRRKMILFFLIDTSGSMIGKKIASVNDAIENVLPMIQEVSDNNTEAEIQIAAMTFATGVQWLYDEPKNVGDFIWQKVSATGMTSLGRACEELSNKLSRSKGFMPESTGSGYYAPAIILLSDGGPTDNFQAGLDKLKSNKWFENAIKIAIAIGEEDADKSVLEAFTGTNEAVVTVQNLEALKSMIQIIALTSSKIGSTSATTGTTTKQEEVIKAVNEKAQDVDGANTVNSPASPGQYDDWD